MALIRVVKQSIRFNDSKGTVHHIQKGAAAPYDLPDEHLEHPWIKAHVDSGNIMFIEPPDKVTIAIADMTIAQLNDQIRAVKPDFDSKGMKKADLVEALKALKTPAGGDKEGA